MDAAAHTHHWMEELLQGAWETSAGPMEPAVSLEQQQQQQQKLVLWKDALKE